MKLIFTRSADWQDADFGAMISGYLVTLPGGAGLEFLGRPSMKNLLTKGVVCL